jgi:hypothetical protein
VDSTNLATPFFDVNSGYWWFVAKCEGMNPNFIRNVSEFWREDYSVNHVLRKHSGPAKKQLVKAPHIS